MHKADARLGGSHVQNPIHAYEEVVFSVKAMMHGLQQSNVIAAPSLPSSNSMTKRPSLEQSHSHHSFRL